MDENEYDEILQMMEELKNWRDDLIEMHEAEQSLRWLGAAPL